MSTNDLFLYILASILFVTQVCALNNSTSGNTTTFWEDPPEKLPFPNKIPIPDNRPTRDCSDGSMKDWKANDCCAEQMPVEMWYKKMPSELPALLDELFPETKPPFPGFTAEHVYFHCPNKVSGCWIDLTWLKEGAGHQNAVGYFFFDPNTGTIKEGTQLMPLWPDTSQKGSKGCHYVGDTVRIENIPYDSYVGFWLTDKGANLTPIGNQKPELTWYSVTDYNVPGGLRNGDGYDKQLSDSSLNHFVPTTHFGIVRIAGEMEGLEDLILLGIEDLPQLGDRDFNDAMFALQISKEWDITNILTYNRTTKIIYKPECITETEKIEGISFSAKVAISDPNMNGNGFSGVIHSDFVYSWEAGSYSVGLNGGQKRADEVTIRTVTVFDSICTAEHDGKYVYGVGECGCEESFIDYNQPQLFFNPVSNYYLPNYETSTLNGETVRIYKQNPNLPRTEAILELTVLDSNPDIVLKAVWRDGRVMTFSDHVIGQVDLSVFDESQFDCTCKRAQDIVLLVERSNNIVARQMQSLQVFLRGKSDDANDFGLIGDYIIDANTANFAVASYDDKMNVHLPFYDEELDALMGHRRGNIVSGINSLSCGSQQCGNSVGDIANAINEAVKLVTENSRRTTVSKSIIVVTNGWHATPANNAALQQAVQDADAAGVKVFTVFFETAITRDQLPYITLNGNTDDYVMRYNLAHVEAEPRTDINSRVCLNAINPCGSCCGFCDLTCGTCIPVDDCIADQPNCNDPIVPSGTCCARVPEFDSCKAKGAPEGRPCNFYTCKPDGTCVEEDGCVANANVCETAECIVGPNGPTCVRTPMRQDIVCEVKECVNGQINTRPLCPPSDDCFTRTCFDNTCNEVSKAKEDACSFQTCVNNTLVTNLKCNEEDDECYNRSCSPDGECLVEFLGKDEPCSYEECVDGKLVTRLRCDEQDDPCFERFCEEVTEEGVTTGVCRSVFQGNETVCTYDKCVEGQIVTKNKCPIGEDECYVYSCSAKDGECLSDFKGNTTLCHEASCVNGSIVLESLCNLESDACYERFCDDTLGCQQRFLGKQTMCWFETCGEDVDGKPILVNNTVDCSADESFCFAATCDPEFGCVTNPKVDPNTDLCLIGTCNDVTDAWEYKSIECASEDACFTGTCVAGKCVFEADPTIVCQDPAKGLCDLSYCENGACVSSFVECVDDPLDCNRLDVTNFPTTNGCNPSTGKCVHVPIKCAPDGCIDKSCSASSGTEQCVEVSQDRCTCNCRNDACVQSDCDLSDPNNPICTENPTNCTAQIPDFCQVSIGCDPAGGCQFAPVDCSTRTDGLVTLCDVVSKDPTDPECCVVTPKTCINDNPTCFDVACDPSSGSCVKSSKCRDPRDKCEVVSCVPNKGCSYSNVTCNSPPNACYVGTCVPTSGECRYDLVGCDDGNPCTIDSCDPVTGGCTHTPKDCSDGDLCTTDTCDTLTGQCKWEPKDCSDGDLCTRDVCTAGVCSNPPRVCDDNNLCTNDSCDALTGACLFQAVDCNDGNACTRDSCDLATGTCNNVAKDCSDSNSCTIDSCDTTTGLCSSTPMVCKDNLACTLDSCDNSGPEGVCVFKEVACNDKNPCTNDSCSPTTGKCIFEKIVCNDSDLCTNDYCSQGECIFEPVDCDDGDPCTIEACDASSGTCVSSPVVCDDGDLCTTDTCVNGECVITPVDCDDGSACTVNSCNPDSGSCESRVISCDDGVSCTEDKCLPESGCTHTPLDSLCQRSDPCSTDTCDLELGCVSANVTCPDEGNFCTSLTCKPFHGCQEQQRDCEADLKSNGKKAEQDNDCQVLFCNEDKDVCAFRELDCALLTTEVIAGGTVGAAVIVGIVVAVIAVLACTGGGVYAVMNKTGLEEDNSLQNNPLYQGDAKGGDNVLYKGDDAAVMTPRV